jgi:hypothetical protein
MRILELDKMQNSMNFTNFMDFKANFVGTDKAIYMRLSA